MADDEGLATFSPWARGSAVRGSDGTVTATMALLADLHMRLQSAEISLDGLMLTCVFEPADGGD